MRTDNVRALLNHLGVEVRFNLFSGTYEHRAKSTSNWRRQQDDHIDYILVRAEQYGFFLSDKALRTAIKFIGRQNEVHPVKDYLNRVEAEWDGEPRLDTWLATYANVADNDYT